MFQWFLDLSTLSKIACITLYAVTNALPMWIIIYQKKAIMSAPTQERFLPFVRNDTHSWSYVSALFTQFFVWPRFLLFAVLLALAGILT